MLPKGVMANKSSFYSSDHIGDVESKCFVMLLTIRSQIIRKATKWTDPFWSRYRADAGPP
jgi:hypothetical protein